MADHQMSLHFYAGAAGVTYVVQSSTDLQNWSSEHVSLPAPDANLSRMATVEIAAHPLHVLCGDY